MKGFLQTGYLLPLAVAVAGFATTASGIVDQTSLRWTAAGLGLLVGVVGVGAKFRADQRSQRQRLTRRCLTLRAALEHLLEAAGWLPDYFAPGVRLADIEQRVRVSSEIRRDLEVESAAPGVDIDVDAERLYRSPAAWQETPDGDERAARIATLEEVAAEHGQVVVLGDPGTGKSWLLRNYARELTRRQLDRLPPDASDLPDAMVVPVLVRADELTRAVHDAEGDVWAALAALAGARSQHKTSPEAGYELRQWLREQFTPTSGTASVETVVLVDAFDERPGVAGDQPDWLRDALNTLAKAPHARLVLCSRIVGYHSPFDHGVEHTTVQVLPFDLGQIERFIDAWYHQTPQTADQLQAQIRVPRLRTLAAVPLLLSFLCLLGPEKVSGRRAMLYRRVVERLLQRPWERRTPHLLDRDIIESRRVLLGAIANEMSQGRWRDKIAGTDLRAEIDSHCRDRSSWTTKERTASAELQQLGSVLTPSGTEGDSWVWLHRTLHEFCLADHLVGQEARQTGAAVEALRSHLWYDPDWYETIALTGGLLADPAPLLDAICGEPNDVFFAMLLLAAAVLAETSDPAAHDHHRILDRLRSVLTSPATIDFSRALAVATRVGPPALEPYQALADTVPGQRRLTLAKAAAPVSGDAFEEILVSARTADGPWVRSQAAQALGQLGPAGVEVLIEVARGDADPSVRREAAQALGQLGPAGVEVLSALARTDGNPSVRQRAAEVLGQLGERGLAAEVLGELACTTDDLATGLAVAGSLVRLGPEAVEALCKVARTAPNWWVRHEAARALAELGERLVAVEVLSETARTPDLPMRHEAAEVLGQLGERRLALEVLTEVVRTDGDPSVRQEAAQVLAQLGPEAAEALSEVARTDGDPSVRQEAARALAELGERQVAVEVLTQVARIADLSAGAAQAREAAATALAQLGERSLAVQVLSELARSPHKVWPSLWLRKNAATALGQLGERQVAVEVLSELARTDDDSSLRWRAAKALGELAERSLAVEVLSELARTGQEAALALAQLGEHRLAAQALGELARTAHNSSVRWDAAKALEELAKQSPALVIDTLVEYPGDDLTVEVYDVAARIAPQVRQASPGDWEDRRARLQTFARWSERQLTVPTDGRQ